MKIEIKAQAVPEKRTFPRLMRGKLSKTLYLIDKTNNQYLCISLEKGGQSGIYYLGVSSFEEVDAISVTLSQ